MKQIKHVKMVGFAIFLAILIQIMACSSTRTLNDFFGIEMNLDDADEFKIASYTESGGAKYYSNSRMNPQVYSYAGIDVNRIKIKIVNISKSDIIFNYNLDQFFLITATGKRYLMIKGDRLNYPTQESIRSNHSVQFLLELPSNFWQAIGLSNKDTQNPNLFEDFWKGENSLEIFKDNIKMIEISLAGETTLILKPLP